MEAWYTYHGGYLGPSEMTLELLKPGCQRPLEPICSQSGDCWTCCGREFTEEPRNTLVRGSWERPTTDFGLVLTASMGWLWTELCSPPKNSEGQSSDPEELRNLNLFLEVGFSQK